MDEQQGTDRNVGSDDGGGRAVAVGVRVSDFETIRDKLAEMYHGDDEAVAALDRIEAEVERLSKLLSWALDDRDAARAEVERLRAEQMKPVEYAVCHGNAKEHKELLERAGDAEAEVERLRAERVRLMFGRDAEVERLRGQRDVSIEQGQFHARKSEEGWSEVERLRTELGEVGDLEGEIERLRAECRRLDEEGTNLWSLAEERGAEVERLRAALERIAKTDPRDNVTGKYLIGFARNALAGEKV